MTLLEYVKDQFKDGVELFRDEITITKNNTTIKRNTARLKKMSLGIISCSDAKEWYDICRLNCEVGTVIEPYKEELWKPIYDDMLLLVKNDLTAKLIMERTGSSAKILLNILERRDGKNWSPTKDVKIQNDNKEPISISIVGL